MALNDYSANRDDNGAIVPGLLRAGDTEQTEQQVINAIRQLMADLKTFVGSSGDTLGVIARSSVGDCYLDISGGNLVLSRYNGSKIFINGTLEQIPSGGVSLSPTGVTTTGGVGSTAQYYIYAFMNAGTMTLEFSATAYATDATYGHKIKNADATRTLVGMWMASGSNTWSTVAVQGVSWFNPRLKFTGVGPVSSTTASASNTEISTSLRNTFISFTGRIVYADMQIGLSGHSGAAQNHFYNIGVDGTGTTLWSVVQQWRSTNSSANTFYAPHHARWVSGLTEVPHFFTPLHSTSSATLSSSNVHMDVVVWG